MKIKLKGRLPPPKTVSFPTGSHADAAIENTCLTKWLRRNSTDSSDSLDTSDSSDSSDSEDTSDSEDRSKRTSQKTDISLSKVTVKAKAKAVVESAKGASGAPNHTRREPSHDLKPEVQREEIDIILRLDDRSPLSPLEFPEGPPASREWADRAVSHARRPLMFYTYYGKMREFKMAVPVALGYGSVLRMESGKWLDDDIVNGFMSLLWESCPVRKVVIYHSQFFLYEDMQSTLLTMSTNPKRKDSLKKYFIGSKAVCGLSEKSEIRLTLFPLNVRKSHWILMGYDHDNNTWVSYDSFNEDHRSTAHRFHLPLMTMMGFPSEATPAFKYKKLHMPQQPDMYQCGVWTCIFALCVVTGKRLPEFAYDNPGEYSARARRYIAQTLYTNSISLTMNRTGPLVGETAPFVPGPSPIVAIQKSEGTKRDYGDLGDPNRSIVLYSDSD
jgi:hypothetical protein